jgi:hypothetical protein
VRLEETDGVNEVTIWRGSGDESTPLSTDPVSADPVPTGPVLDDAVLNDTVLDDPGEETP